MVSVSERRAHCAFGHITGLQLPEYFTKCGCGPVPGLIADVTSTALSRHPTVDVCGWKGFAGGICSSVAVAWDCQVPDSDLR